MSMQWLRRLIYRRPAPTKANPAKSANQAIQTHTTEEAVAAERFNLLQGRLDDAFFSWLLACSNVELRNDLSELKAKQREILQLLDQEIMALEHLPRRPASLPMLIRLLNDEEASHAEITRLLLSDPALTAQILKTANSPYFRLTQEPIETVEQAVLVLGNQGIRNIVSATVMKPVMTGLSRSEALFSEKVWQWGLVSANANDRYLRVQGIDPGPIYMLSLLPSLAYLTAYRSMRSLQKKYQALQVIEPVIMKSVIQTRCWAICRSIARQWALPSACDAYLEEQVAVGIYPLTDGLTLGQFSVLRDHHIASLEESDLYDLTQASAEVGRNVVDYLATLSATKH